MSTRYREVGVDLERAEQLAARLKDRLGTGLFGGFVPVSALKTYRSPVLVSSIDGIGTKLRLAAKLGRIGGLGQDIVHHCVNDIAVHGAHPLFFLDYLAFHRLEADVPEQIVAGIASACDALGIRLAGGETAEMPLVYPPGHFDLAGAIVGVVEEDGIVDGSAIRPGDVLLSLPASGLHTNGFSLIQALFTDDEYERHEPRLGMSLADALLEPHRCYLDDVRYLISTGAVHGLAHITGGGLAGNLTRIMPPGLEALVELPPPPAIFQLLQARGVSTDEMRRVFNMGVGMIAVCDRRILSSPPASYQMIGSVRPTNDTQRRVRFDDRP